MTFLAHRQQFDATKFPLKDQFRQNKHSHSNVNYDVIITAISKQTKVSNGCTTPEMRSEVRFSALYG